MNSILQAVSLQDIAYIASVVSAAVAAITLTFLFFRYLTRPVACLRYVVTQLSNYDWPPGFIQLDYAPISVQVVNEGTKGAENTVLAISTLSEIIDCLIPESCSFISKNPQNVEISAGVLNPHHGIPVLIRCKGSPLQNQIAGYHFSHKDGLAQKKISGYIPLRIELISFSIAILLADITSHFIPHLCNLLK